MSLSIIRRSALIALLILWLPVCGSQPEDNYVVGNCHNLKSVDTGSQNFAKTHWTPRPTGQQIGVYAGVGVADKINLYGKSDCYFVLDGTLLVEKNFAKGKNSSFFASSNGTFTIANGAGAKMVNAEGPNGTEITYGIPTDVKPTIRSTDLGLADTYAGTFCFAPEIMNVVANIDFYAGLDNFAQGLYFRARAPITYSHWNIGLHKSYENSQQQTYPIGFIDLVGTTTTPAPGVNPFNVSLNPNTLNTSLTDGGEALLGEDFLGQIPPLYYGQITGAHTDSGVADIPLDLGLNWVVTERFRFGTSLHVVVPTGTQNDKESIFSPRIGLGRWQFGGQAGTYYHFTQTEQDKVTWFAELCACAITQATERRLLGLYTNNKSTFNHYLLVKKMNAQGLNTAITAATGTGVNIIDLERASNLLYQNVTLGLIPNVDFATWVRWQHRKVEVCAGWEILYRGAEKVANPRNNNDLKLFPDDASFGDGVSLYLIKGDAPMYIPNYTVPPTDTIGSQQPSPHGYGYTDSDIQSVGALYPTGSVAPAQDQATNPTTAIDTEVIINLQEASLTAAQVTAAPALHPSILTNSLYLYVGRNFETEDLSSFIGGGFQVELARGNSAMNFFALFVKGGFTF